MVYSMVGCILCLCNCVEFPNAGLLCCNIRNDCKYLFQIVDRSSIMFGFGLGIKGAAIATVAGQMTSFIALLIGSSKGENNRLSVMNVRLNIHASGKTFPALKTKSMRNVSSAFLPMVRSQSQVLQTRWIIKE